MKNKNHIIRLAAKFLVILVAVGLLTFSYVFAQNELQNEETINSCIEWVNGFEEESFFDDVKTPTFPAKTIHFVHLLVNSYEEFSEETSAKFFPQRAINETDFINMLQDFNELTKEKKVAWFNSLLLKKSNKKLTQNNAVKFASGIFKLSSKTILAEFRRVHLRGKWILRREAAEALYRLTLKELPESPEQSLCKKWANDDAEAFSETFGQEKINTPANPVGTSTSNGTTSDAGTTTLPTTGTSTLSSPTPASPAAPAPPVVPATTGTSTQPVATPASPTIQSPSPPTILSITPYVPISLNQNFISSITLQWNAVSNPSRYLTYYKAWRKLGNGDWLYWANTQRTTFPDLSIGRGTYYYYVNACYDPTGSSLFLATDICGPDSNIMTATIAGGGDTSDTTPPSAPTGFTASIINSIGTLLSWTASTDDVGVAGYNIYRNGAYLMSVSGTAADAGVASSTYSYTVAAYDAAGNISAQSASVSVTAQ